MEGISRETLERLGSPRGVGGWDKKMWETQMGTEGVCETQKVWEAQAEVENLNMWDVQAEVDSQKLR